jgi:hypothetical protein
MKTKNQSRGEVKFTPCGASECGATHSDCANTWKGSCDREAGHEGSHHCNRCQSVF